MHPFSLVPLATTLLHVPTPERALEIECREGEGVLLLAREFPAARVRGVDRSPEAIRRASAVAGLDPEGRVAFKQGSPGSLPYPDEMFDLVVQAHGRLRLAEILRVLRPGGHLAFVERPLWRLPPAGIERSARRLERRGFETVETGEAEGLPFYVGRLREDAAGGE